MRLAVRSLVFGYIGVLWGCGVIGYGLTRGLDGSSTYSAGSAADIALGFVLFVAGSWILLKRARAGA